MAKILIVDDHPVNRQFLVKLLGYVNHTVSAAADGREALEMVRADRPDLIITDIVMPNMDGPAFVQEMRRDKRLAGVPVIFYTASHRVPNAAELARQCNAVQVMYKPAKPGDVLAAVSAALHLPAPAQETRSNLLDAETLRLAALTELGFDLVREAHPSALLRRFVQSVRFLLGAAGVGAIVTDPTAPAGGYAALAYQSEDLPGPSDLPRAADLLGKLVNWQPTGLIKDPAINPVDLGLANPIRTLLLAAIPLPQHASGTAWLYVINPNGSAEFTREDERLTVTLATQLAVTFENARLHAKAAAHTETLQAEIAERKRAEAALADAEASLSGLVASAMDGIITLDDDQRIVRFNPAAEALFQCKLADALGQPIDRFIPARFRANHREHVHTFAQTGVTHRRMSALGEVAGLRSDGTEFPLEASISQIEIAGRKQFSVILRDITKRKSREELLALRTRAAQLSADVGMALTRTDSLRTVLQDCARALVDHLDAAFARIWTLNESSDVLELQASAGLYTHLDGPHSRVPVGSLKIGLIAQERRPHLTNDVLNDPRVSDPEWARREGMAAFAGYPLLIGDRLLGVCALFARQPLPESILEALGSIMNQIALGIERKRAEAERDALLARLRMQIDRMPLGYLLFDSSCRIIDWNSTAEQIFGFTKDEVLGMERPLEKLLPMSAWPVAQNLLDRLRAGDMAAHAVNENLTKDGRIIACQWYNTPLLDGAGAFAGFISLAQDITERKHLEERVRQTRERLNHVVSSSPAVLYTLAIDGEKLRPTWISDNIREMMGWTPEEVYTPNWWEERVHSDDIDRAYGEVRQILFTKGRLAHEHRFRHKNNAYVWIRSEMRLLHDADGQPVEVVGSWSDITERKNLEEQFRQAQKMEAIGQLAGGVAHDFNNLLTIINGYGDLYLRTLRTEDPLRAPLEEIRKAGERANGLTRQLLAFSRKQVLQPVVLDLNLVLQETEKMLKRLIGEDVELTTHLQGDLWKVKADAGQIEQVVMNIVVNARDAMPMGGKLLIETKNVELNGTYVQTHTQAQHGEYVLLAISDTGTGMDEPTKARIFEPFFTTKGPTKGTGLGLATVFGIVKQSGGQVEVYSELGHGTTFKVYLPRDHSGDPVASGPRAPQSVRGGAERILLVEDEAGVRLLAKTILVQHGYKVIEAQNGGEAFLLCEGNTNPIDLLITDVIMPHMSGRELAQRLVKLQPTMKVLYMSGYTDDAIVHHGVLESGTPFLQKPFAPDTLVLKVREILDAAHRAEKK